MKQSLLFFGALFDKFNDILIQLIWNVKEQRNNNIKLKPLRTICKYFSSSIFFSIQFNRIFHVFHNKQRITCLKNILIHLYEMWVKRIKGENSDSNRSVKIICYDFLLFFFFLFAISNHKCKISWSCNLYHHSQCSSNTQNEPNELKNLEYNKNLPKTKQILFLRHTWRQTTNQTMEPKWKNNWQNNKQTNKTAR